MRYHDRMPEYAPALMRFVRYAFVGVSTLILDLGILYVLTTCVGIPYYISTPLSFLVAASCNYFISRHFVFKSTKRKLVHGYLYFIGIVGLGALVTTGFVFLLVTYVHLYYLLARVLIAGIIGMTNYLLNLFLNFKVAGSHV